VAVSHPYVCLPATRMGVLRRGCIDVPPSLSARALFRSGVRGAGSCSRSDSRSFPRPERSSLRRRGVTPFLARWLGSTTYDRSTSSSPWNRPSSTRTEIDSTSTRSAMPALPNKTRHDRCPTTLHGERSGESTSPADQLHSSAYASTWDGVRGVKYRKH
jgi:hypothetical protein